jgi:anaerobic magnesium-protoporphyrin IX monomethyl ester cyclase
MDLVFKRTLFALCPTGTYCREDRCQSYFNFELIPSLRAPLEECEGAGGVERAGGTALIIDAPAAKLTNDKFIAKVLEASPNLIVLAITFGSLEADLQWAHQLKCLIPHAFIALRGAPCYVWAEDLLRRSRDVDLCVRGDYELVFERLVTHGPASAGCTYRERDGSIVSHPPPLAAHLDSLPQQARHTLDRSLYKVRGTSRPQATIHVQRGCPFPCTFCLVHAVSGNRARHRSPDSIVHEVNELMNNGINHFYLRAETFSLDKKWAIAVSRALENHCAGAHWVTATRVECINDEVIDAMKAGGCYGISFGVDVASNTIGARVKKPPQKEAAFRAMRLCDRFGVVSLAYVMIGFIWDTKETLAEASSFIRDIRPDLLTVHFAHPYPGTPYYEAVQEHGAVVTSLCAQAKPAFSVEGLTTHDFERAARSMLLRHYLAPSVLLSLLKKYALFKFPRVPFLRPTATERL